MKLLLYAALAVLVLLLAWVLIDTTRQINPPPADTPAAVTEPHQWWPTTTTTPPTTTTTSSSTTAPARTARTAPSKRPTIRAVQAGNIWDRVAQCESGGRWDDTRGQYEGGLHFLHDTWVRAGGRRFAEHAYQATREQQIEIAQGWLERTSWAQWPVCSRKVGAR